MAVEIGSLIVRASFGAGPQSESAEARQSSAIGPEKGGPPVRRL